MDAYAACRRARPRSLWLRGEGRGWGFHAGLAAAADFAGAVVHDDLQVADDEGELRAEVGREVGGGGEVAADNEVRAAGLVP